MVDSFTLIYMYFHYIEQLRKNYLMKGLQLSAMSYIGGGIFGLVMLAFASFGGVRGGMGVDDLNAVYYNSFNQFKSETRKVK